MPATPQPAATVILLRDSRAQGGAAGGPPEVLLLRRHGQSDVLPDMYVFPGGRVKDSDRASGDSFGPQSAARVRALAGTVPPELAAAYLVAAIRETFEEAGILLARPRGSRALVGAAQVQALAGLRLDVQAGRIDFLELIEREGLELAADAFAAHAHWITPEPVKHRFDTLFLAAVAPAGQRALHDGFESTDHVWIRPEDALAQAARGERRMIFPTLCNLDSLAGFASAEQAFAASQARPVVPVMPSVVERDGRQHFVIPPEAGYRTLDDFPG